MRSNRNRRLRWAAIPIVFAMSCSFSRDARRSSSRAGCPTEPGTTNQTDRVIGLWVTSWIVLLAVGVVTWGLIIWAAVVYRRRKGQTGLPVQLRYNMPIEIFYTIVPLILVLGFFAFTARDQQAIEEPLPRPRRQDRGVRQALGVGLQLRQRERVQRRASRPQERGERHDRRRRPPDALPAGRAKVEIKIQSRDVIHSFWIVELPLQEGHDPGQDQLLVLHPREGGCLPGQVRRAVWRVPLAHAVRGEGRLAGRVRRLHRDAPGRRRREPGEGQLSGEYNANQNLPGNGAPSKTEE